MDDSGVRALPRPLKVPSRLLLTRLDPLEALENELQDEEPTTRNLKRAPLFDTEPCVNLWSDEEPDTPPLQLLTSSYLNDTRVSIDPMGTAATVKVEPPLELLWPDGGATNRNWNSDSRGSDSGLTFQMTTTPQPLQSCPAEDDITLKRQTNSLYEDSKVVPLPSLDLKTITVQQFESTRRWLWISSLVILVLLLAGGWAAYVLFGSGSLGV